MENNKITYLKKAIKEDIDSGICDDFDTKENLMRLKQQQMKSNNN